ncbi:MAG: hypothetical protein H0T59_00545 [Chloroflexi bacterium]|nr:hypothetical protein [Chloroflexota bacterium]
MRRILLRLVHNWHLKLGAVALATLMYGGLALSQSTLTYQGAIPVRPENESPETVVLSSPQQVTEVRYFAPTGVTVAASTFVAKIDLATIGGRTGVVSLPIEVTSPDSRVTILGFEPPFATIEVDRLDSRDDIPVTVLHGQTPDGLTLGLTTIEPATVTVSGAASIVARVDTVRADVTIQATGIDVDNDIQLVPVDKLGNELRPLNVTPATARVTIPVFSDRQSRTLTVNPIISGTPAAGFEIESVSVEPQVTLVAGDADQLAELARVDTEPISVLGVSADEVVVVGLAPPTGVVAIGDERISVSIKIRPVTATRTFNAGLRLIGAGSDMSYAVSVGQVLVTIGGSTADLNRLVGAALVMDLDVSGLEAGIRDVPVTANLPAGTTLVTASPETVRVTIGAIGSLTSPAPSAVPSASPAGG